MFRKKIAIDLGTANTLAYEVDKGLCLNEPSVVAVEVGSHKILAVGTEAKKYIGRTPGNIAAIRPLHDGVIADFDTAKALISFFIKKVIGKSAIRPDVVICVPPKITEVERRAVLEAASSAGGKDVRLICEVLAAGIGAGLDIFEPRGQMIVDIGGGTTDVAIITMGEMAAVSSIKLAGDALNANVQRYLQEEKKLLVGENMAEKIKIELGNLDPTAALKTMNVSGKDAVTGGPKTIELNSHDLNQAFTATVSRIVQSIMQVLESAPPELGADILSQGILLLGGGSLLSGLAGVIHEHTKMPVRLDSEPLTTVLRGAALTLGQAKYKSVLLSA